MSIFSDCNYIYDALGTAVSPHTAELRTALSKVIVSHEATAGCKPREDQVNAICNASGEAVAAIMLAMADACKAFAEVSH